jgi:hypothetical protein
LLYTEGFKAQDLKRLTKKKVSKPEPNNTDLFLVEDFSSEPIGPDFYRNNIKKGGLTAKSRPKDKLRRSPDKKTG